MGISFFIYGLTPQGPNTFISLGLVLLVIGAFFHYFNYLPLTEILRERYKKDKR